MHITCFIVETFQGPIQLQRLLPLTMSLALGSSQWNRISVQGSPAQAKGCTGSHLAFIPSGLQICWEGDGFLIGDHASHPETKHQGQQDSSCCVHFLNRKLWLPYPYGRVSAFHIIFHWITVFWDCPNSFKMTFLCGLMFLICYNLHLYLPKPRTRWNTFWSGIQTVTI